MKLTRGNIEEMVEGVGLSCLPKTFQDAIIITRKLGLRFLWIDSLCIIQDSADDWATESSSMRLIYKNCLVNIAATGAEDGSMGFFFDRDPIFASPCRLKVKKTRTHDFVPSSVWLHDVNYAPLNSRAWVVQEQLLAPRVLHFGKRQLFWECNELVRLSVCFLELFDSKNYQLMNPNLKTAIRSDANEKGRKHARCSKTEFPKRGGVILGDVSKHYDHMRDYFSQMHLEKGSVVHKCILNLKIQTPTHCSKHTIYGTKYLNLTATVD
jgi:hypothetical protein